MVPRVNGTDHEPTSSPQEWESFYEELFDTPEERAEAERDVREMIALRTILQRCEEERERAGLSKAELARIVGVNPASMRRLFTDEGSNPTLKTMIGILAALDLELVVKPISRRGRKTAQPTTSRSGRVRALVR